MRAAALALFAVSLGCTGARQPTPAELDPLAPERPRRAALPDDAELGAGRLAALVLADRPDSAVAVLQTLREVEVERRARGEAPSGLLDNAEDLIGSMAGPRGHNARAEAMLGRDDLDPTLRKRLQQTVDAHPLRYAEVRLAEERRFRIGSVFNRVAAPLSQLAMHGFLNPIDSVRSVLSTFLTTWSFPATSVRERQALRAYEEYLARNPEGEDAEYARKRAAHHRARVDTQVREKSQDAAAGALQARRPQAALLYLERVDALGPVDPRTAELRRRAGEALREQRIRLVSSLGARRPNYAEDRGTREALHALTVRTLIEPMSEIALRAHLAGPTTAPKGERLVLSAFGELAEEDEDGFFALVDRIRRLRADSPMARHADAWWRDPSRHAFGSYRAAQKRERSDQTRWLVLGRHARGVQRRGLPRPFEYLIELPGVVSSLVTLPVRLIQLPSASQRFGARVTRAGERYLQRYPQGQHAEAVHADLGERYAKSGRWTGALQHHRALSDADPAELRRFGDRIAEQMFQAAGRERRTDMRLAIYRSIVREYPESAAAGDAREEVRELLRDATPQGIRVSREFLQESPELWDASALGLRSELMDSETGNGELHPDGVTLLGRNTIRVALEDRDPVIRNVPPENFARFVSLLEDVSYRLLATDPRENPAPDPQRDQFFDRARLGLLDRADHRPTARSDAVFLGRKEKHGPVFARKSILPIELVVRGDLESLGLAPVPRLILPEPTADAFLYE